MYQSRSLKEHRKQQHCPTCNTYVKHSQRYPRYCCNRCACQAVDQKGNPVEFSASNKVGRSCEGRYATGESYHLSTCFIKGIKCKVEESTTGSVMMIPVPERKSRSKGLLKDQASTAWSAQMISVWSSETGQIGRYRTEITGLKNALILHFQMILTSKTR